MSIDVRTCRRVAGLMVVVSMQFVPAVAALYGMAEDSAARTVLRIVLTAWVIALPTFLILAMRSDRAFGYVAGPEDTELDEAAEERSAFAQRRANLGRAWF